MKGQDSARNAIWTPDFKRLLLLDDVIAFGDIPQVEDGKIIGSISCSGGTDAQHEVACMTGATTISN